MLESPYQVEMGARLIVLLEQPDNNHFKQILLNKRQYNAILEYIVKEFTTPNSNVLDQLKLSSQEITGPVFSELNAINDNGKL